MSFIYFLGKKAIKTVKNITGADKYDYHKQTLLYILTVYFSNFTIIYSQRQSLFVIHL